MIVVATVEQGARHSRGRYSIVRCALHVGDVFANDLDKLRKFVAVAAWDGDSDPARVDESEIVQREDSIAGEVSVRTDPENRFHELIPARARNVVETVETMRDMLYPAALTQLGEFGLRYPSALASDVVT